MHAPDYPLFPGLDNRPFHDAGELEATSVLEANAAMIRDEWASLPDDAYMRYAPSAMQSEWRVLLFHYMGVAMPASAQSCPGTRRLLPQLPSVCLAYPWGDALFFVHVSDSHLRPHCSVDNLRVRCHLGLQVPSGCSIRVGKEIRQWQEGRVLLFEDSYEHEVWNRGDRTRAILILDFWHPGLSLAERDAITAGFARKEVRSLFMWRRLNAAQSVPQDYAPHLEAQVRHQEDDAARSMYWS
jgi:aspartyl/asparaginyl beta-hydroxylase (cupin superfamily)